jgi:hypothetical protein
MSYCKGRVTAVHHCSGCWEVIVEGEQPGAFPIDNCCIWPIVDAEGADWIGRQVEYRDGCMRFLDGPHAFEDNEQFSRCPSSPRISSPIQAM